MSFETQGNQSFWREGYPGTFAGISRGALKFREKIVFKSRPRNLVCCKGHIGLTKDMFAVTL